MKYILILFIPLLFFSCKKKFTQFYIDYNHETTIPATVPVNSPVTLSTPEKQTNSTYRFESNDTRKDKIEKIILKDLVLTITAPQSETFSFLNSIEVYIDSDNHPETKVAYKNNISEGIGNQLVCEVINTDLQKYIKEDAFTVKLVTVTDEVITQDIEVNIYSNFFVDAKLVK
ncbi:MAG: hypothetical protein R3277_07845 [Brumimicrobium sp.]|nr:hypothetical protein [Brumimicrobium sp.]